MNNCRGNLIKLCVSLRTQCHSCQITLLSLWSTRLWVSSKTLWRWPINTVIEFCFLCKPLRFGDWILSPPSGKSLISWIQSIQLVPVSGNRMLDNHRKLKNFYVFVNCSARNGRNWQIFQDPIYQSSRCHNPEDESSPHAFIRIKFTTPMKWILYIEAPVSHDGCQVVTCWTNEAVFLYCLLWLIFRVKRPVL
jgi:hypothetical protein